MALKSAPWFPLGLEIFMAFECRILVDSIFTNNHKFKKVILSTNNTVGLKMSKMMKFPIERCYNCGKKETLSHGILADLERVEVELENYSDEEEMFMPLCNTCAKKWEKGELKNIEEKWKNEKNKNQYSSTIGQWKGDYGSIKIDDKQDIFIREAIKNKKIINNKIKIIQFNNKEEKKIFIESNDPIAKIAELEGVNYIDECDQCKKDFEVIISGGKVNYYLCSEHFNQLTQDYRNNERNREGYNLMKKFCPFFKEICKGKECVMWNDEKCHIISYLKLEHDEFLESEDIIEHHQRGESEVPEYLKTRTAEEIALDLLEFWKKNDPNESRLYDLSGMFWEKKGIISTFDLSAEMRHKKNQALFFANRMFDKEEKEKIKEQIAKEKEELPSLVSHCIDWSKSLGLKRLTHADIDAYLLEKNLVIRPETRRALYSIANVKLKSKQV